MNEDAELNDGRTATMFEEYDHGRTELIGCHKSFMEYRMLWLAQEEMEVDMADEALLFAFSRMPKLRDVVVSDWRALALPGETFSCCVKRLFGKTLSPEMLTMRSLAEDHAVGQDLGTALRRLALVKMRHPNICIRSLAIGTHPFDTGPSDSDMCGAREKESIIIEVNHLGQLLDPPDGYLSLATLFSELHQLHLNVMLPGIGFLYSLGPADQVEDEASSVFGSVLTFCPELRSLTVTGDLDQLPVRTELPRFVVETTALFQPLQLAHLHTLELWQWIFTPQLLKGLLSRHAASLRWLYLIDCFLFVEDETSVSKTVDIAQWGARNLNLSGIELGKRGRVEIWHGSETEGYDLFDTGDEQLWLDLRPNLIARRKYPGSS
jgi:hypothetical protein